ncbi:hypothetical protein ACFSTH_11655 [Paenibacillus yanchengensis]|uniref:DUF2004 domain-containing protein n=1 Tax=Paenibacillus yanchengensis TaxID=2035833 RepID=A0ABW4YJ25_9BACL
MNSYKITKYNPTNSGNYDEWTSISDVGQEFSGVVFTIEEYLRVEEYYVNAITRIMKCIGISGLFVSDLHKDYETPKITLHHNIYTQQMKQLYGEISENQFVSNQDLQDLCKMILRELIGLRLVFEDKMFVHFGYDYYMYIGVNNVCMDAIDSIQASGLFVEECESPYYQEDKD